MGHLPQIKRRCLMMGVLARLTGVCMAGCGHAVWMDVMPVVQRQDEGVGGLEVLRPAHGDEPGQWKVRQRMGPRGTSLAP